MSDLSEVWRKTFATWPSNFRRKGVVVPVYGEAIPFSDFVMNESLLILERPTPDNTGARRVALPFGRIHNLKYTEPLKTEQYLKAGFVTEMAETLPEKPTPPVHPPQPEAPKAVARSPELPPPAAPQPSPQPPAFQQAAPQQVMAQPQPVAPQPVMQPVPVAVAPQQLLPAAAQPYQQQAVPQPIAAPAIPQQPTPEQIQAAMIQRQQMQHQQMQVQPTAAPTPAQD